MLDRVAGDAEDHIARLDAGLRGRAVLLYRGDQRAARTVEPERLGELRVEILDGDADAPAHHAAGLDQLLLDVARDVDWNREREPHEAARAAEDLRVDADHLTRHVEQRPAGV